MLTGRAVSPSPKLCVVYIFPPEVVKAICEVGVLVIMSHVLQMGQPELRVKSPQRVSGEGAFIPIPAALGKP